MGSMFDEVLREDDIQILRALPETITESFYLAGGTALALQIGHRYSFDFDFFSIEEFSTLQLKNELTRLGAFRLFQESKGTLEGRINQTRMTYLYYPYALLHNTIHYQNLRLAAVMDIALMKLSALSGRGSKKDFIDLYFLKELIRWDDLIQDFEKKYQGSGYNLYHLIKSLAYFTDARNEPDLHMIKPYQWEEVEDYFKQAQIQLTKKYL